MLETVLAIPFWAEMLATLTGAISGSMHAVKHNYDMFGVCCLACITGLSGGIVRDILLQDYGIYAFQHWELILVCMIAAIPVFFFCRLFNKLDLPMDVIDTVSIALFAIIGAGKAFSAGYTVLPCAILGTITAVGGGCVRDLLLLRPPRIFISGTLYASATFIGALVFLGLKYYEILPEFNAFIGVAVIIVLRFVSVFFDIKTRPARDYSDKVSALASKLRGKITDALNAHRKTQ